MSLLYMPEKSVLKISSFIEVEAGRMSGLQLQIYEWGAP